MNKEQLILKQVALKGAVELTKDQFKVDQDIQGQVDIILNVSDKFYEYLKNGYIDPVVDVIEQAGMKAEVKSVTNKMVCPNCGSKVWDNRATAKETQPKFKCSNNPEDCTGKKGAKYAWSSWDEDEFDITPTDSPQEEEVIDPFA